MIASHDFPDQRTLNRWLKGAAEEDETGNRRPTVALRFLRNLTTESIDPYLQYHAGHRGIGIEISHGDFDAVEAEIFSGITLEEKADLRVAATVFCLDQLRCGDPGGGLSADETFAFLSGLWEKALEMPGLLLAIHTLLPAWNSLGAADEELKKLNGEIRRFAESQQRVILTDFDDLVRDLGWAGAVEPRFWYLYRAPFQEAFLNAWAVSLASEIALRLGRAKKLLLLDCDNTLWGGVVGEDGLDGIQLDPNAFPGSAFVDFQNQALELHRRGVLIGLISKNNEADVFEVFEKHPGMRLRREHLVGWRVNWQDKAANIRELAAELNLGLDSAVFIDDSPHECEQIRRFLPMVDVLPLPENPWEITSLLNRYPGFPLRPASAEDQRRTAMYREEAERKRSQAQFADHDAYLRSLELRVGVRPAAVEDRERVAQLTQRTNQFNLATNRYQEHEIDALMESPDSLVFVVSVADRFGDYGKVGVAIVQRDADAAEVRDFLLSCRVLGRRVETAFLDAVIRAAIDSWGVEEIRSAHVPSAKNQQTAKFFDSQGWEFIEEDSDGRRAYRLATKNKVENSGFIGTVTDT